MQTSFLSEIIEVFHWHHQLYFIAETLIAALIVFGLVFRKYGKIFSALFTVGIAALASFLGARVMHALLENPELLKDPKMLLSNFDGMTFNGSLLFGGLSLLLTQLLFPKFLRVLYWDLTAITTALAYAWLRVGCFITGCCWGKVDSSPWAVKYYHSSVMPWTGIPTHPVQLYDALGSLLIAFLLLYLFFKFPWSSRSSLFPLYLLSYSILRFFTEFYRGDDFRGVHLWLDLSTSQWVCLGLGTAVLTYLFVERQRLKSAVTFFLSFALTGCFMPSPPQAKDFKKIHHSNVYELYETKSSKKIPARNAILVTADKNIQYYLKSQLNDPRLDDLPTVEDLAWWQFQPLMSRIYKKILRLQTENVSYESIKKAFSLMEDEGVPYDVIFLTHGMPNHLSTGQDYFLSFREINKLDLKFLNLVFMQSCFSESLVQDWQRAGARHVIGFAGLNINYFFYGIFLKWYYPSLNAEYAFKQARYSFDLEVQRFPYVFLLDALVNVANKNSDGQMTRDLLIEQMDFPKFF